jgi:hypothetical protein
MSEPITITHSTDVADPFHRTADIVELLRLQARQEVLL